ncbi:MAG: hypothetical protein HOH43_07710, partial [Candidatus Latescibacteria bacterium]|nr:hypothetical protein [Candidatus Latescibacterota bacterium]
QRLNTNPMVDQRPVWPSDGTRLGFFSLRSGSGNIYTVPSDGSGSISTLGIDTVSDNEGSTLNDWSSDDRYIIYQSRSDLWYRPVSNDATPVQLTDTPYDEARAQLSPDDQYVVYESNASGQMEIYVTPFPSGKGRWQISVNGGGSPRWNPKSNELFYLSGNEMMAVTVRTDTAFEASIPQVLFQAEGTVAGSSRGGTNYDVSQDGRRFLMLQQVEEGRPGQPVITLIQNWALQNRAPQ